MKHTVLIVDDREENIYSLSSLLKLNFKDIDILEAKSGDIALKIAIQTKVDLVILDVQMPDMDGFEVAKMLKSLSSTKDIPIIFLSAFFKDNIYHKLGFELGAVDYLVKPIDNNQLINRVSLYLRLFEVTERERLQRAMLIQQSKMASLGEMLSAISHQWKQPLNVISAIAHNLSDSIESNRISRSYLQESIDDILTQIEFMSSSMSDFKNFYTPSKDTQKFSLKLALQDLVKIIENRLFSNSIDLKLNIDRDITIFGVENEFNHAVLNIVNNSIDAIEQKRASERLSHLEFRGVIDISLSEDSELYILKVRDNGGGVDKSILNRVFKPYFSSKGENGSGIGLYISRTILDKMGGDISIENFESGLESRITLPKGERD